MVLLALALAVAALAAHFVSLGRTAALQRQVADLEARLRALELGLPLPARVASAPIAPASDPVVPPVDATGAESNVEVASLPPVVPTHDEASDFEAVLGERWMLYAGLLVLLLGVAFFLKYAFEQAWIDPLTRCSIGLLAGVALIPSGLRIASRGYERYGHLLTGAGIVTLYLTIYAALNLYALISPAVGALALVVVTLGGTVLADLRRSLPLAVLAVAGGYLTPLFVGGTRDAHLTLFSYLTLLTAGTITLARRRGWPQISAIGYVLTVLVLVAWAGRFYSPDKHVRVEVFLTIACALFLRALATLRGSQYPMLTTVLATAPILYHAASLVILWAFGVELFVYLILFSIAALGLSVARSFDGVRLAAWLAVALPFLVRVEETGLAWTAAMLATASAIFGMHLAAQVHRLGKGAPVGPTDVLLLHGNGVFACLAGYIIFEHQWIAGAPWIAWGLAAAFGALGWSFRKINLEAALHWGALALALLAAGVAIRFDGSWVIVTIAAEGAGAVWIGLRVDQLALRTSGLFAIAVASAQWLSLATSQPPSSLRFLLNERTAVGAFIVGLIYAVAAWHRRGRRDADRLVPALIVAAQLLTVAVLTLEATAFWEVRTTSRFDARVASQLSISLVWAAYAAALVVVGLRRAYPPVRYVGMALFAATLAKVFLSDLSLLDGFYRVAGFLIVGAVLVLVSFLYQRASARAE